MELQIMRYVLFLVLVGIAVVLVFGTANKLMNNKKTKTLAINSLAVFGYVVLCAMIGFLCAALADGIISFIV